jgi:cellulose biosynthesis protein BcsQ
VCGGSNGQQFRKQLSAPSICASSPDKLALHDVHVMVNRVLVDGRTGASMAVSELLAAAKEIAKEYYPLFVIVSGLLGALFGHRHGWWYSIWNRLHFFWSTDVRELKKQTEELQDRLNRVRDAFGEDNNLWLRQPVIRPDRYDAKIRQSIPILLIANLKGGVGKTTIAANLAAYFETKRNERVLAIDLDHQGSLSSMLLPEPLNRQERTGRSVRALIEGSNDGHSTFEAIFASCPVRDSKRDSRVVDCDDPFADLETQLALKWLIGDIDGDIRYNFARVLHSEEVQKNFQRVIIDAPPRITTGFINALCASTHLVVPFVLDRLSAERVGQSLERIRRMKGQLFPHLELAGVVGTMKGNKAASLRDAERESIAEAKRAVRESWGFGDFVLDHALIPRTQAIADAAGIRIVYPQAIKIFDPLGDKIFRRVPGLTPPRPVARSLRGNGDASRFADSPVARL